MKLYIFGSNGMLGSMLYFVAKRNHQNIETIPISREEFNVQTDSISKLDNVINAEDSIIVNCIGAIPQKKYSDEDYKLINTTFPQELSLYCKSNNIKLIHISTNCVFSGTKNNCGETDQPDATDIYGLSKYLGEPAYGLVIRCSIIGPEKHTFCGLMEWFLNNSSNEINGFIDSYWNGLTTLELSTIIFDHIQSNKLEDQLIHYYSENTLSKYEIISYFGQIFGKKCQINKKENGTKYYTLSSNYTKPRKNIYNQIDDIKLIFDDYKKFYNLK